MKKIIVYCICIMSLVGVISVPVNYAKQEYIINQLWDFTAGNNVVSVAISYHGEFIIAGSADKNVYFFNENFTDNKPLWNYTTGDIVNSVSIDDRGENIVAGGSDNNIYSFNRDYTDKKPRWHFTTGSWIPTTEISNNGCYIAAISAISHQVLFFNNSLTNNPLIWNYTLNETRGPSDLSMVDSGNTFVVGNTRNAFIFDKNLTNKMPIWQSPTMIMSPVEMSPNGEFFSIGNSKNISFYENNQFGPIQLWNYTTNGKVIFNMDMSFNGQQMVAGMDDYYVYFFDKNFTGAGPCAKFFTGGPSVVSASISDDGKTAACGTNAGNLSGYSRDDTGWHQTWNYQLGPDGALYKIALSKDGKYLVTGGYDHKVHFFQIGSNVHEFSIPTYVLFGVVLIAVYWIVKCTPKSGHSKQ